MKKNIILLAIITLTGCGTRKTNDEKTTSRNERINIENHYDVTEKTVLGSSFTFSPFDGLKPMEIEGRKYNNVIISGNNHKEVTKTKNLYSKYNIVKNIEITKTKSTSRTDSTILYLGLFFILCLSIFLWFYFNK